MTSISHDGIGLQRCLPGSRALVLQQAFVLLTG